MSSCNHDGTPGLEGDLEVAREARGLGEWAHAGQHLASALAIDPRRPEVHAEIAALIAAAGDDPQVLAPLEDAEPWYGVAALHALLLARRDVDAGFDLLCQVVAVRPDVPYLTWALDWLTPERTIVPGAWHTALSRTLSVDTPPWSAATTTALFEQVHELARRLRTRDPASDELAALQAIAARRCGRWREAVALAEEAWAQSPSFAAASALANALRAGGDLERAVEAYQEALDRASDPVPTLLDLGDTLLDADRLTESLDAYAEALRIDPEQPWALPSLHYVRFLLHGDGADRDRLREIARQAPRNPRAAALVDAVTPWVGYLPPPTEQAVNTLRRLTAQYEPTAFTDGRTLPIRTPWLEAPSVHLATAWTAHLYDGLHITIDVEHVPSPDPRLPLAPTGVSLWSWTDRRPTPALPAPPMAVTDAIARMAVQPFHLPTWKALALEVSRELAGARIQDVLAAAVHPPEPPATSVPWTWVQRFQVATALVLTCWVEDRESPAWLALEAMALGTTDWTTSAGITALCEVALDHPELATVVRDLLLPWFGRRPAQGPWCIEGALVYGLLRLPSLSRSSRRTLEEHRRRMEFAAAQRRNAR